MYIHRKHQLNDPDRILSLIDEHPLATWVLQSPTGLVANHIPFVLDRTRGPLGTLIAHVSRGNPVWKQLRAGLPSLVMFLGPHAYISPGWYPGRAAHGKVVPTWDYVAVHVHGTATAIDDRDWLLDMLNRMTDSQEAVHPNPWRVDEAPADYIERMMRAIVGIEIPIERVEAKCKASQDEDMADRLGTVEGLRRVGTTPATQMADWVADAIDNDPRR